MYKLIIEKIHSMYIRGTYRKASKERTKKPPLLSIRPHLIYKINHRH